MTPLEITDPDGSPLPNPFPVNVNGFGPAFAHATLDRVAWLGGGFTGFVTSYEGMKQVAVDAQAAAAAAASTAGAEAAAVADAAVASVIADADAAAASAAAAESNAAVSATAAANSAALVGAPADTAIAAAVNGAATETKTALNAAYLSARTVFTDDFGGSSLGAAWGNLRPDATGYRVTGGNLEIDTLVGSIFDGAFTAKNIINYPIPAGKAWVAEAKITSPITADGQRIGLIALNSTASASSLDWAGVLRIGRPASNFRRGTSLHRRGNQRWTGRDYTEHTVASYSATWWARLVWDGRNLTAYDSVDGVNWVLVGRPVPDPDMAFTHIGLYAANSTTGGTVTTAKFESFTLTSTPITSVPVRMPKQWVVNSFTDPASTTVGAMLIDILRKNAKYNLTTWWAAKWASQDANTYIDFKGTGDLALTEYDIRPAAMAAHGAASVMWTGHWDTTIAGGMTEATARTRTIRWITSLAKSHYANTQNRGWGYEWQSQLWASWIAQAGWMLWQYIPAADQENIKRMVEAEATYQYYIDVPFWKNPAGVEQYVGDSKGEELGWMSLIWQTGVAMMPDHPDAKKWARKMVRYIAAAWSKQADLSDSTPLHGQAVSDYLNGWNVNADGTVINHNLVHPDYMAAVVNTSLAASHVLAMGSTFVPKAALRNVTSVWGALSQVTFATPPYNAPGGTIYKTASADLYYPQGNDWSDPGMSTRIADKAAFDATVSVLGLDTGITPNADAWAQLHLQKVKDMQARFTTGQVYLNPPDFTEDNYTMREQWIASNIAPAWLTHYAVKYKLYRTSNGTPETFLDEVF